jgi:excisionase family DNA binding protein
VTADVIAGLRSLAEALPTGAAVPVPREWLLELLAGSPEPRPQAVQSVTPADLTVAQLAARFGRKPSTVRGWLDRGLIPGAYRFQGREWRVPAAALAAFEARQRPENASVPIVAPRAPRGRPVDLGAWRSASYAGPPRRAAPGKT